MAEALVLDKTDIEATIEFACQHLGIKPFPEQWPILLSPYRFNQVSGGDQSGKSYCAAIYGWAHYFIDRLKWGKDERLLYWLVADRYEDTSQEFEYIARFAAQEGFLQNKTTRVDPGEITLLDGTIFKTKSAQEYRTLHKEAPNGIIACEGGLLSFEAYNRISGRAGPKRAWIFMSGTIEFSLGWWIEKIKQWSVANTQGGKSFILPSWTNKSFYPGGREDPEILRLEREHSKEWFMERCGGEPCPPSGLVFKDFRMELHVGDYPFDPQQPVFLWIDPGYGGAYAVLVAQIKKNKICIVDEVFKQGYVTEDIIYICQQKPWWPAISYGVIDYNYGGQHQAQESVSETWLRVANKRLASQKIGINQGNERIAAFLRPNPIDGQPGMLINYSCQGIISEFGGCLNPETKEIAPYRWKVDKSGIIVGKTPDDKHNHAVAALRYGIVDKFGYSPPRDQQRASEEGANVYNW